MRRDDKEVREREAIAAILEEARVCRIGMCDRNFPYVVPMTFVYRDNSMYLHSAREGRKIEILKRNSRVCIEVDLASEVKEGTVACDFGMYYRSVIGSGTAWFIEDADEKKAALDLLMDKYGGKGRVFSYAPESVGRVAVIRIDLEELTGKESGDHG